MKRHLLIFPFSVLIIILIIALSENENSSIGLNSNEEKINRSNIANSQINFKNSDFQDQYSSSKKPVKLGGALFRHLENSSLAPEPIQSRAVISKSLIKVNWNNLADIKNKGNGNLKIDIQSEELSANIYEVISNWGGGYTLVGNISEEVSGDFMATVHESSLVANFSLNRKKNIRHFSIAMNTLGLHELQEVDPNYFPVCGGAVSNLAAPVLGELKSSNKNIARVDLKPKERTVQQGDQPSGDVVFHDDNIAEPVLDGVPLSTVDVMIVYTAEASEELSDAVISSANQAINWTSRAFTNSEVDLKLRLVHLEKVPFEETGDIDKDLGPQRM